MHHGVNVIAQFYRWNHIRCAILRNPDEIQHHETEGISTNTYLEYEKVFPDWVVPQSVGLLVAFRLRRYDMVPKVWVDHFYRVCRI